MKIVQFTAENIKKLKAVSIKPDGNLVQITGANGQGKSSVLDAIFYALAGTTGIAQQPVRKGAGKGHVSLDLGEMVVRRTFVEGGGTMLYVEAKSGARFPSPQKLLDDLLGKLTFDPLAFVRMDSKSQLNTLRSLVDLGDVDVDTLAALNKTDYDRRTDLNRTAKTLTAQRDAILITPNLPEHPVDVSKLVEKLSKAADHNSSIAREIQNREGYASQYSAQILAADKLKAQLAEAEAGLASMKKTIDACKDKPLPDVIDTADLAKQIESGRQTNAAIETRNRRRKIESDLHDAEREVKELTESIAAREKIKADAIAGAKMPLDGLSFGEGTVIFGGLPLEQASDAEQLSISVAIAMAANPTLRVLRIKDGSLLDEKSLQLIAELADAKDYQVWIERVDTSGKVGIVMEDGEVRGATAPVEKKQPAKKVSK